MDRIQINAISNYNNGIASAIYTPIEVADLVTGKSEKSMALWDTGSTGTLITQSMASKLGLSKVSERNIIGINSSRIANTYAVRLTLNKTNVVFDLIVAECKSIDNDGNVEILLGMDIITKGDFAITNFEGKTLMSFRMPSIQKIDFVEGINQSHPIVNDRLPGRNQPCFCGSGIKYKHCHGKGK